jgi:hypothetical protein
LAIRALTKAWNSSLLSFLALLGLSGGSASGEDTVGGGGDEIAVRGDDDIAVRGGDETAVRGGDFGSLWIDLGDGLESSSEFRTRVRWAGVGGTCKLDVENGEVSKSPIKSLTRARANII